MKFEHSMLKGLTGGWVNFKKTGYDLKLKTKNENFKILFEWIILLFCVNYNLLKI